MYEIPLITYTINRKKMLRNGETKMTIQQEWETLCGCGLQECNNQQLYQGLVALITKKAKEKRIKPPTKKLYYLSAEFLTGRLLTNNLLALGLYDSVKALLSSIGKSLDDVINEEPEPSLGNGGLGRLASCFLDSIASLDLAGDGVGLCYHLGLFRQVFKNHQQTEYPNPWREPDGFLQKTNRRYPIPLGGKTLYSTEYTLDIIGKNRVNTLHLFDLDTVTPSAVKEGIEYDQTKVEETLTLFLYPDDREEQGKLLRLYQQYFLVSNAAQLILEECEEKGRALYDLPDYAVIQINDTHPALVIPELIRLLCEKGIPFQQAVKIVTDTCAYTNHTVLAEALETWPLSYFQKALPHLVPVLEKLAEQIKKKFPHSPSLWIIDEKTQLHMARLAVHFTFATNGVAALHTHIIKTDLFPDFYKHYPTRFHNKTNGIALNRWLTAANPLLNELISSCIGDGFHSKPEQLENLLPFGEDSSFLDQLTQIKYKNKEALQQFLQTTQGSSLSPYHIYDVQIKRLHEYKRQQLNLLWYIHQYLQIKRGIFPKRPIVGIFGAKAAPAYTLAKDIIHALLCLQKVLENDPAVAPHLQLIMVENYNVTAAERIIPACEISEQISLASKEASGTGNMKMMVNGGLTLGTLDGANVEIHQLVGDQNIYLFGMNSHQVMEHYEKGSYHPKDYYTRLPALQQAVDFLTHPVMISLGNPVQLERLQIELKTKDWFMTLGDFESYLQIKEQMLCDYENTKDWAKKSLVNIAKAGYFSSHRTIREYNNDIWHLQQARSELNEK